MLYTHSTRAFDSPLVTRGGRCSEHFHLALHGLVFMEDIVRRPHRGGGIVPTPPSSTAAFRSTVIWWAAVRRYLHVGDGGGRVVIFSR